MTLSGMGLIYMPKATHDDGLSTVELYNFELDNEDDVLAILIYGGSITFHSIVYTLMI